MRLISIDPGKHRLGWAAFCEGQLTRCGLVATDQLAKTLGGRDPDGLIIEVPQIYRGNQKENPNDLVDVAVAAGQAIEAVKAKEVVVVRPREWKGQRPKAADNRFTLGILDGYERTVYARSTQDIKADWKHNVIDAIGIGLWWVKRR